MESECDTMKHDAEHLSEYDEAIERFENNQTQKQPPRIIHLDYLNPTLDTIIKDLCRGDNRQIRATDISLFYELIFYIDYKQIKTNLIETIYTKLCDIFVLRRFVDDISANLNRLDSISHVKTNIMQGFLKILQVKASVANNCLILAYSNIQIWSDFDLNKVNGIQILPCAYKVMVCNDKFSTSHLNFLLQLAGVENIILEDCNLNGRNPENVLKNVKMKTLNLSKCGTSVNIVLQSCPEIFINLTCLNIEGNPLQNESLCHISNLPLKTLNISGCIRRKGKFIDLVWIDTAKSRRQKICSNVDFNLLWAAGALKANIQNLDVSSNDLFLEDFITVLKLNLKELNIAGSIERSYLSQVIIPDSLRVLIASNIELTYDEFKILCGTRLKKLDIEYNAQEVIQDFSVLSNSPLLNTLTELTVCMTRFSNEFLEFISEFKLKYFNCSITHYRHYAHIDNFFLNYPEERKFLETLILSECEIELENDVLFQLSKLNLKELSISVDYVCEFGMSNILSSKTLKESLVSLKLTERGVNNEDLLQILEFKRLEKLSFAFNENTNEKYLKMVVEMKTLKNIELEANIDGNIDLHVARLLCIASVKNLNIFFTKHVTDEACEYLTRQENFNQFTKNLEELFIVDCVIDSNLARILQQANWISIVLFVKRSRVNFLQVFSETANFQFTLQNLHDPDTMLQLRNVADLMLSSFGFSYMEHENSFEILKQGRLLKFLYSMTLQTLTDIDIDAVLPSETNLSIVRLI